MFEITNSLISQFLMLSRNLCVDIRGTQVAVIILLMNQRKKKKKEEKYKIRKIIFYTHTAFTLAQKIVSCLIFFIIILVNTQYKVECARY